MIGEVVGSYRIERKIGEGGMGVVYLAEHALIGRKAAVKLLLPEMSNDNEMVSRFFREAKATSRLRHPGLVDVFDFGFHPSGCAYIVMDYLEGESMADRLEREGRFPAGLIASLVKQITGALAAAHAQGIVHRDLKPDNLFLCHDGAGTLRVKVLDFGIAKLSNDPRKSMRTTRTGAVIGTPLYMSPEQSRGSGEVDWRTDIYSLGCIMFEIATGRPPFLGKGYGEVLAKHIYEKPPRPSAIEPSLPPALEAVILKALSKDPDRRQQSVQELARELEALEGKISVFEESLTIPELSLGAKLAPPLAAGTLPRGPGGPNTLTGAAGEAVPRRRRVAPVAIGSLIGLCAGVVLLATRALNLGGVTPSPAPVSASIVQPLEPAPRYHLVLDSHPTGAAVFRASDGVRLGQTPFRDDVTAAAGDLGLVLRLDGYLDRHVMLPVDHDGETVVELMPAR